jgi:hypothetical protein
VREPRFVHVPSSLALVVVVTGVAVFLGELASSFTAGLLR